MARKRRLPVRGSKTPFVQSTHASLSGSDDASLISARDAGIFLLLLCLTLATYWPAVEGGPVWDDENHLTRPELQSLHGLWRIWSDVRAVPQYYPLLHSAFWFEHQ